MQFAQKGEFAQVQSKLLETNREITALNSKIQMSERARRRALLTLGELSTLNEGTVTYKSVGKMFLAVPKEQIETELNAKVKKLDFDLKAFADQGAYIKKKQAEYESAIKEVMINSSRT